jgi:hypothetical protein
MEKFTSMVSAKAFSYAKAVKDSFTSRNDDESGDIVQTLIIIGISVVLGGLLLTGLSGLLQGCLSALGGGTGQCFGVTPK